MFSSETREEAICRLHESGHTVPQIRKLTGIRHAKVISVINYFEEHHSVPPTPKNGRPKNTSAAILTQITALTIQNRMTPCFQISQQLLNEGYKSKASYQLKK